MRAVTSLAIRGTAVPTALDQTCHQQWGLGRTSLGSLHGSSSTCIGALSLFIATKTAPKCSSFGQQSFSYVLQVRGLGQAGQRGGRGEAGARGWPASRSPRRRGPSLGVPSRAGLCFSQHGRHPGTWFLKLKNQSSSQQGRDGAWSFITSPDYVANVISDIVHWLTQ